MTQNQDLHIYLDQSYQSRQHHPITQRQQYIGPWIQQQNFNKKQKMGQSHLLKWKSKQQLQNNLKNKDFLTIFRNKRKKLRTTTYKQQNAQKIQFFNHTMQNLKQLQAQQQLSDKLLYPGLFTQYQPFRKHNIQFQYEPNQPKKALNTTMYVYHYTEKPIKLSKEKRNSSFDPQNFKMKPIQSAQNQAPYSTHGSKNLQRILKMKQRIRTKNNNVVKKIKEKQIQLDKQFTLKQMQQSKQMREARVCKWRSMTLDHQSKGYRQQDINLSPTQLNVKQMKQFNVLNYNKTILKTNLNLFGASKAKFFHK